MKTQDEIRKEQIEEMIKAGTYLSRHCRNCWTGERTRSNIPAREYSYKLCRLQQLASLGGGNSPLVDWAGTADLNHFYLTKADQHTWDEARWEKEIRNRIANIEKQKGITC